MAARNAADTAEALKYQTSVKAARKYQADGEVRHNPFPTRQQWTQGPDSWISLMTSEEPASDGTNQADIHF